VFVTRGPSGGPSGGEPFGPLWGPFGRWASGGPPGDGVLVVASAVGGWSLPGGGVDIEEKMPNARARVRRRWRGWRTEEGVSCGGLERGVWAQERGLRRGVRRVC